MKTKKTLSLLLALVLCLGLTIPAFAAEGETERGVLTYTEAVAPQYEDAGQFNGGLAAVKKDGKWGYIDEDNNVVIDFQYEYAWSFSEGYAIVAKEAPEQEEAPDYYTYTYYKKLNIGFIDRDNNYTPFISPWANGKYDEETWEWINIPGPLSCTFYEYTYDYDWEDGEGNPQHEHYENSYLPGEENWFFHNGFVVLSRQAYDTAGSALRANVEWPEGYSVIGPMNEGLFPIQDENYGEVGYMDVKGNIVKWFKGEQFGPEITDEWGYTDRSYRCIDWIYSFNQGLAPARQYVYDAEKETFSYLWGFIGRDYNWVIQPQYTNFTTPAPMASAGSSAKPAWP